MMGGGSPFAPRTLFARAARRARFRAAGSTARIVGAVSLLLCPLLLVGRVGLACDNGPAEVLARHAKAIALVEVRFSGRLSRVRVLRWYRRAPASVTLPPRREWLDGLCLLNVRRLRREVDHRKHVGLPVSRVWSRALQRGRYRAIAVLAQGDDGTWRPECAKSERFAPWEGDSQHRGWRQRLLATLCVDGTVTQEGREEACRAARELGERAGKVPPEERFRISVRVR